MVLYFHFVHVNLGTKRMMNEGQIVALKYYATFFCRYPYFKDYCIIKASSLLCIELVTSCSTVDVRSKFRVTSCQIVLIFGVTSCIRLLT